ncbi:hypothetical protein GUJ93_ZPchr0010g9724 [Zizania palustris]|uniref:Uncharacterized protein n=1 Tax=Zizania palustris TaxID=103762 RepID=A0A8J5TGW8_ZIZPA|nr:hypothetical protein GUJ93_ZPchr0010g9724 [Zizania palustris]
MLSLCVSCHRLSPSLWSQRAPRPLDPIEVVGVGSRKDVVIDFCLGSRILSSTPIRFWYMDKKLQSK